MIAALAVENYRSLRHLVLPLERLSVVTGANGSGKSSLYRALRLLADSARNGAVAALAREGGLASVLWAGPPDAGQSLRKGRPLPQSGSERRLLLGFVGDDFGYGMDLGLPPSAPGHGRRHRPCVPGSRIGIAEAGGRFEVAFRQPGLQRPLGGAEVSDGTLRYLLLIAVLLSPRPPELLVLNEPETSLHPDLIGPLAGLIEAASASTQIIVVTHAQPLVTALRNGSAHAIELVKEDGRTLVSGQGILDEPAWHWPSR